MKQVFISYDTGSDFQFAERLADELERRAVEVWIAPGSIRPGEEWIDAIGRGLETSTHFALVSTPAAYLSTWVRKEYNAALLLEADGEIEVIPLEVETAKIPIFLRGFQTISFINKFEKGLQQLATALGAADKIEATRSTQPATVRRSTDDVSRRINVEGSVINGGGSINFDLDTLAGDKPGDMVRLNEPKVFVAYDVRDAAYARVLAEYLERHGIEKWMAPGSIELGARWEVAIVDAIVDSRAIVVLMSPRSAKSQWVQQEILVAQREGIPVFPILLAGQPFDSLSKYQFFDARNGDVPPEGFVETLKR